MFLAAVLCFLGLWSMGQGRRSRLPSWRVGLVLAVLVGLWMLDGVNSFLFAVEESFALYKPFDALRLISGMGMGLALGTVLYPVYHLAFWRCVNKRRVLDEEWPFSLLIVIGVLGAMGILRWHAASYALWFWLVVGAVFSVFSLVNASLVSLLWQRQGFVTRWWQIVPYLVAGLMLSLLEMTSLALLRRLLSV